MGGSFVLKQLMREALQVVLEAEMSEALGAGLGERREGRRGYRAGYYSRGLVTPYQGCLSCGCRETAMGGFRRSCSPGPKKRCGWPSGFRLLAGPRQRLAENLDDRIDGRRILLR